MCPDEFARDLGPLAVMAWTEHVDDRPVTMDWIRAIHRKSHLGVPETSPRPSVVNYYRNQDSLPSDGYERSKTAYQNDARLLIYLMLALADGSLHGHAMGREVEERSGGSVKLGPGSLYWSLGRLAEVGLIKEADSPDEAGDERRRYYGLTPFGRQVLKREAMQLERIVEYARLRSIV